MILILTCDSLTSILPQLRGSTYLFTTGIHQKDMKQNMNLAILHTNLYHFFLEVAYRSLILFQKNHQGSHHLATRLYGSAQPSQ